METWGKYLISAAFLMHGIGMLGAGLTLPAAMRKPESGFGNSWLLARLSPGTQAVIGTVLWGLAGIGFIGAAVGYFLGAEWWRMFAWLGAPTTIAAIALWFGAVPPGMYAGGVLAAIVLGALVTGS